jgi:hypothetical protein
MTMRVLRGIARLIVSLESRLRLQAEAVRQRKLAMLLTSVWRTAHEEVADCNFVAQ